MTKLCYILPEYNPQSPTHFAYLVDFVEELKKIYDLRLIEEKKWRWFLPYRILWARLRGYQDFYVHYSFLAAFFASLTTKFLGGRVFYWNCGWPWQYRRNFLRERFERLTYRLIDFLVTGTEGLKRQYAEHYHLPLGKIKVMPNWLQASNFQFPISNFQKNDLRKKLNVPTDQKVVLFVHRLSKRKGAHYLPEIARALPAGTVLLVVGDGPERKSLELQVSSYKLQGGVRFLGWVPQSEIADYFTMADVFVMPSEEEGFPHVLLEAMAAGTPFVAFDVGGVKEITPPEWQKYIVGKGNLAEFVGKIKELLISPKEPAVEILQKHVRKYDINDVIKIFSKNILS